MILDLSGKDDYHIQFTILHEFGHALGLYHEHQHPQYLKVMKDYLSPEKMMDILSMRTTQVDDFNRQYLELNDFDDHFIKPNYDSKSIMHYG